MVDILEIKDLHKCFGNVKVIEGLDFSVPEGSIFGFVGANGAGKTTTMKMVLGLLEMDSGEITVCGERVSYGSTVKSIGYLPDIPEFYPYMKPMEYLMLCGEIAGMTRTEINSRGRELLKLVGLKANRKIGGFSRGMKQRLGIAQALLNEPKLLICDEPTSALDPVGRKEILEILAAIKGNTTVIFSTHILSDVERICDRVVFLHDGKAALNGVLADIKKRRADTYSIEFADARAAERFKSHIATVNHTVEPAIAAAAADLTTAPAITTTAADNTAIAIATAADNATPAVATAASADLTAAPVITTTASADLTAAPVITTTANVIIIKNGDGAQIIKMLAELDITPTKFELLEPSLEDLFIEVTA